MVTHRRVRMFNTKDTYPDQSLDNDLCQAVVAGDTIYLRGQVGTDFDGNLIGGRDPIAQTEQAMMNIAQLLDECDATLNDIVKVTIYLVEPGTREAVYRVIGRWLKGVHPVSTGLVVAALAKPDWRGRRDRVPRAVVSGRRPE